MFLHLQVPEGSKAFEQQKNTELYVLPGIWLEILNLVGANWNTEWFEAAELGFPWD